jgi:hypothetical protein
MFKAQILAVHLGLRYQDAAFPSKKIPYTRNDSARMFSYSEECLRRTSQGEMNRSLELSNLSNISRTIGKTIILLGQLQIQNEHCSKMIFNKTTEEE